MMRGMNAKLALLLLGLSVGCDKKGCQEAEIGPPLRLPFEPGRRYRVSLPPGRSTHQVGHARWAWDFEMASGQALHSPIKGRVRAARDDSTQGGCDVRFAEDANYVVIVDERSGLEVLLLHLEAGSLEVELGQEIEAGQRVAKVGRTGWTCGDHVHVQLQRPCAQVICQSVAASWQVGPLRFGDYVAEPVGAQPAGADQ